MANMSIFVGSVYGNAQFVAEQVQEKAEALGHQVSLFMDDPSIDNFNEAEFVLFITSTTGQGDIPPNLEFFVMDLKDQMPPMGGKPFAVVGLGDSSYGDSYVGAGKQVFEVLQELQGSPVADMLEIDALETMEPEKEVVPWVEDIMSRL